jgi:hypothetical protein
MFDRTSHFPATLPKNHPPVLLIAVDTEEEFEWDKPFSRTSTATTSIAAQRKLHERVYDKLGIVPTYLIDWPVATAPESIAALKSLMDDGRCEIGTHLHPWVSPPHHEAVSTFNSYAGNLPKWLEYEKLQRLTDVITENFGCKPITFKAGRYGLGKHTAEAIAKLGYKVDASIVPYTSFSSDGGPDFSQFSEFPFWFGDLSAPLLELPVTTGFHGLLRDYGSALYPRLGAATLKPLRAKGIAARTRMLERIRLTPEGCTANDMMRLATTLAKKGCQVMTLTYHSPSAVPGHTPYVRSAVELERFFSSIEIFCEYFKHELGGMFMSITDLHDSLTKSRLPYLAKTG